MMEWGTRAAERLARIATASEQGPGVTRFPFTPEHAAAREQIAGWMEAAGLSVRLDAAGTLIGASGGDGPALLIGSHQDSVRHGGAFDGIMGVALACLAVERLAAEGTELPGPVEVLAFADEEGARFPTALLGPRALAGTLDMEVLTMADRDGIRLRDALAGFGGDPDALPGLARAPGTVRGYLEAHIEQGPVLEREDLPVGIVTGICGIERHAVTIHGETGHAGTVPMEGRRDALVAASALVAAVRQRAAAVTGARATVGQFDVSPNVVNAIPDRVRLTVEIRSIDDAEREALGAALTAEAAEIGAATGTEVEMVRTYAQGAVACDAALTDRLAGAVEAGGTRPLRLPSGATHDASAMADLCPVAMLFVRCRGGVSHRPEEHAGPADMDAAIGAMARFIAAQGAA